MKLEIVVPLAGPDYVNENGKVKGANEDGEVTFLRDILMSRIWFDNERNFFTFVFRDNEVTRQLYDQQISKWFNNSSAVFLTEYTSGAALTALTALGAVSDHSMPLIIDLADIYYECKQNPLDLFQQDEIAGIALTFDSSLPVYSYFLFDQYDQFILSKEKEVISNNASSGTYLFKSSFVYLKALTQVLEKYEQYQYNGLMYVCPVFNGLKKAQLSVVNVPVTNVFDVKV